MSAENDSEAGPGGAGSAPGTEPPRDGPPPGAGTDAAGPEPHQPDYRGVPATRVRVIELFMAVLWALGVTVIGLIALSLFDASVTDPDLEQPDGIKLAIQAFGVLGFISAAIGITMIANRGGIGDALRRLGIGGPASRPLTTFLLAIPLYLTGALVVAVLFQPEQEDIAESLGADEDAALLVTICAGILIIAGAALGEELFFRGLLFGAIRQRLSLWPAAVISGVIFGLPHLPQGDPAVVLQLSIFGVVLAWAYERSGTLWVPIGLHALNNSFAFYMLVTDKI